MLDALKKAFGDKPKEEMGQDAPQQEMQDMTTLNVMEQLNVALDEIVAKDELLGNMAKEIEGYKEQLAALQVYADEAEAKALAAAEEMKAKEVADKQAQLADVIGKDNPGFDTTWSAIAGLDNEAFNVVLSGFKASFAKEAEGLMFNEVGVSGEAEPVAETGLNLKKYAKIKTK